MRGNVQVPTAEAGRKAPEMDRTKQCLVSTHCAPAQAADKASKVTQGVLAVLSEPSRGSLVAERPQRQRQVFGVRSR